MTPTAQIHHRLIAILALAASTVLGCTQPRSAAPPPASANAFSIERSVANVGTIERIWLDGGVLRRESRTIAGAREASEPIVMTPARMDALRGVLSRYAVWRWDDSYVNAAIFGGASIQLEVRLDGRSVSTTMWNRGPAFGEDGALTYSNVGLGLGEDVLRALRDWFRSPMM